VRAAVAERYGSPEVVEVREIPKPTPGDGEILIRIHATTISAGDVRLRAFRVPAVYWIPFRIEKGILRPKDPVLGVEFSGEIEAVGSSVTRFRSGDEVYGYDVNGCHAEYKRMSQDGAVTRKPANMAWEEAAAVPHGALAALYFLRKAGIGPGKKVLINGAAGAVGIFAVQLAKHFGAEVTGVGKTDDLDLVRSLGADAVIDYTSEDFTEKDEAYDVILDTPGTLTFAGCRASLTPTGALVVLIATPLQFLQAFWTGRRGGKRVIVGVAPESAEALDELREMIEAGAIRTVISRRYRLDEIVEAHRFVDQGHKTGNVVIGML
jgi:NADPH:quinone reductase-like Zn-dependent oxidoreductase